MARRNYLRLIVATVLLAIVCTTGYATKEKYWDFLTYSDIVNINANFMRLLMENQAMRKKLSELGGS